MMAGLVILAVYSIIHLLEAWLEEVVIDLKNPLLPDYHAMNRAEHFRSAVVAISWFICAAAVMWLQGYSWLLLSLIPNRRVFFDYPLILFRNRPKNLYEGNDWWVNKFVMVFGKRGRLKELAVTLLFTAFGIVAEYLF